ncbi:MAG: hypothetical protein M0R39_03630 [Prolixibacteraceae bacterium]|jgi:glycerate-2-kinase|nr:hypothetical protein [Prolixibacteraceae bacterium]
MAESMEELLGERVSGGLLKTGPTYTNVMDIRIVLIDT